jgi:hypothetical protein
LNELNQNGLPSFSRIVRCPRTRLSVAIADNLVRRHRHVECIQATTTSRVDLCAVGNSLEAVFATVVG